MTSHSSLGPLQQYIDHPDISEIMVINNGDVWVEDCEGLHMINSLTMSQTQQCLENIVRSAGRRIDLMSPILDARLPDGSRACAVLSPIAVTGPTICIRKFSRRILPLAAFGSSSATDIVRQLVNEKANVVLSGATSSGKTSLLSAASQAFQPTERIVCVEDTAELRFAHPHVVRLQTRPANQEGNGEITMQALVRTSLRLRPDRLVIGEVRGVEVVDMLLALSSGHRGSWSTVHASNAKDALHRLSTLMLRDSAQWSSRHSSRLIHSAIDVVIHVKRISTQRRAISEILQLHQDGSQTYLYSAG